MKHLKEYEKSAVITLLPNPVRHIATLRIEINPREIYKQNYLDIFEKLCSKFRDLGFSVNTDGSIANYTKYSNIIEFVLASYCLEVQIAKDIAKELEEIFGEDSVLNRVMIKKELKKL